VDNKKRERGGGGWTGKKDNRRYRERKEEGEGASEQERARGKLRGRESDRNTVRVFMSERQLWCDLERDGRGKREKKWESVRAVSPKMATFES